MIAGVRDILLFQQRSKLIGTYDGKVPSARFMLPRKGIPCLLNKISF
jgi:hypothetical protein